MDRSVPDCDNGTHVDECSNSSTAYHSVQPAVLRLTQMATISTGDPAFDDMIHAVAMAKLKKL